MKQKTALIQQKAMTEEEEIMNDPELRRQILESEEAEKKGVKPWKLPLPWKRELDKKFDDIKQGKEIKLSPKLAGIFDQRFLQSLSDIKAGRIRRVR